MYENPSAGKFDPPPDPARPGQDRPRRGLLTVVLLLLSGYPVTHRLLSFRGRGWLTALSVVTAIGLEVFHYTHRRRRADEHDAESPFSEPTSLTR